MSGLRCGGMSERERLRAALIARDDLICKAQAEVERHLVKEFEAAELCRPAYQDSRRAGATWGATDENGSAGRRVAAGYFSLSSGPNARGGKTRYTSRANESPIVWRNIPLSRSASLREIMS